MNQQPPKPASPGRLAPLSQPQARPSAPAPASAPATSTTTVALRRSALLRKRGQLLRACAARPDVVSDILHDLAAEVNPETGGWLLGAEHVRSQLSAWGAELTQQIQDVWTARKEMV